MAVVEEPRQAVGQRLELHRLVGAAGVQGGLACSPTPRASSSW